MERSAKGVLVDMASLVARHEKVRAVGNMGVNARGDIIDPENKIIVDKNSKVQQYYDKKVGDKPVTRPQSKIDVDELTPEERLFEDEDEDFKK